MEIKLGRDNDHKDLPLEQAQTLANRVISVNGGPDYCKVFFKFTCKHCRARQTFEEANTIFTEGSCEECGKVTKIQAYGFMVVIDSTKRGVRGDDNSGHQAAGPSVSGGGPEPAKD